MKSKTEYVTLLSNIVATSFAVHYGKENNTMGLINTELQRILMQTDFDDINCIYEHILDFFSRTDKAMNPKEIEELARITQICVTRTITTMFNLESEILG